MEESLKYKDLLLQSQEEREEKDVQFQVEQAELQLQSDTLATKQSLAEAQCELAEAEGATPFNASVVIARQVSVEELEDGLERLEKLKAKLF